MTFCLSFFFFFSCGWVCFLISAIFTIFILPLKHCCQHQWLSKAYTIPFFLRQCIFYLFFLLSFCLLRLSPLSFFLCFHQSLTSKFFLPVMVKFWKQCHQLRNMSTFAFFWVYVSRYFLSLVTGYGRGAAVAMFFFFFPSPKSVPKMCSSPHIKEDGRAGSLLMTQELQCLCHPAHTMVIWEGMAAIKDIHHTPCLELDVNKCSAVPQKKILGISVFFFPMSMWK